MNTLEMPAATRRPEELVPSRYALNIGDIEVLVVSDGVLPLPAVTMATNAVRPTWPTGWARCSCRRTSSTGR
jgi:hypothetical protein